MHSSNASTLLRIANMFNAGRKTTRESTRSDMASRGRNNEEANKGKDKHASKTVPESTTFDV